MADGFGHGGFSGVPYPFWLSPPSQQPPASAPPFLAYDPTQGGFDPMISHQRSPVDWSNNPSYRENSRSQTPSSSFYADNSRPPGNCGPRVEYSYKDMGGFYSSRESSSDFVPFPFEKLPENQPSFPEMVIRASQEPFINPIAPSSVCASSNALDENHPGNYYPGYDKPASANVIPGPRVTDAIPPLPMSSTHALFDESQTGIYLGDGRSFPGYSGVSPYAPENFIGVQSNLHGSSVEPVNFDVLLGYGEATGHIKPLSEKPDFCYQRVGSPGSTTSPRSSHPLQLNIKSSGPVFKDKLEGSGVSSLYPRPNTLITDYENGISESSLKNTIGNSNLDEPRYWTHFMVSSEGPSAPTMFSMGSESCGATKADSGNAQFAVNDKTPFKGSANQPSEDVQANQKPCELQEQMFDLMNRDKNTSFLTDQGIKGSSRSNADDVSTDRSPERHLCDQGDFPSATSSPRVSSVVNAMHNLSEVLVYECFNNGSWLKLEQLENLDKVVDNLTKCLKKITSNKTIAGEASLPTQAMHVSCPNMVNLNEAPKVVAKDFQGVNEKPIDSFGFKESVDKNEMTQSIKNILASNFPDGEENHPQTLLYKNLWLETEAALCSTTCMARYHRIKNEIGNLKLQTREISADASTFMEEPLLNPQKSVGIMNNVEQETTESLIKHRGNCGNNVVPMSHDTPQSSRFNSDPVDAVLSFISRSFIGGLEQKNHGNFHDAATSGKIVDTIQQESSASTREDKHNDVIDRFQILKNQETNRKLKSQNCPETKMGKQEDNPEASDMVNTGRSSHVSDVMDRFQILKRREELVQKTLNSLDIDSDSDNDQPKAQMRDHLWSASMMTRHGNPQMETCVDNEPSASGKGYESPTSDWEHVRKDD
ncbi:hypothetical protein AALP_AA5G117700 [Arabis alpina]|uniref:Uncharacterized protein n=1 Tax=Arabis alpina TaxID=50452 RepID=A0A087GWH7_ARAAL|nr:hypothetical protein AALP_AA5G117700 [Arabis alpina]